MMRLKIIIYNLFYIKGSYNWALREMKKGYVIKADKLNYCLLYDYQFNCLMVAVGHPDLHFETYIFCNEKEYILKNIISFYTSTHKAFSYGGITIQHPHKATSELCRGICNKLFKL